MPYDYELLKKNVSTTHPEVLDAFVEGWNKIGPLSQAHWRQLAFVAPKVKVERRVWLSWTALLYDELFDARKEDRSFDIRLSTVEKQLAILFHNSMQYAAYLFGLPHMPPLADGQYYSPS